VGARLHCRSLHLCFREPDGLASRRVWPLGIATMLAEPKRGCVGGHLMSNRRLDEGLRTPERREQVFTGRPRTALPVRRVTRSALFQVERSTASRVGRPWRLDARESTAKDRDTGRDVPRQPPDVRKNPEHLVAVWEPGIVTVPARVVAHHRCGVNQRLRVRCVRCSGLSAAGGTILL
jgi:hypothetical protein